MRLVEGGRLVDVTDAVVLGYRRICIVDGRVIELGTSEFDRPDVYLDIVNPGVVSGRR